MQRIAVPMIGGMVSSTILTLLVITAVYALVKGREASPAAVAGGPSILALSNEPLSLWPPNRTAAERGPQ
jgi:hypothetical protein